MPIYLFEKNNEIREVFFKMNDEKRYFDENNVEWKRVYICPNAGIDTRWDANSSKDFIEKTGKKKGGTLGQLWEKSKELSQEREKKLGKDPIKEKMLEDYKSKRCGRAHPEERKQKLREVIKDSPFELSED